MFSIPLTPVSWLYGLIIYIRNLLFDCGILKIYRASAPVISVGNITMGGTGKTPFVEYLLRYYENKGIKLCVISRGYKRLTEGMQVVSDGLNINGNALTVGDEPYQIAKKFPRVMVVVSEKRSVAAEYMTKYYKPDLFILDDGFQHRSMGRNLDVVVIDGQINLSKIQLLPAGPAREFKSALRRADLIVRSHTDQNIDPVVNNYSHEKVIDRRYKLPRFLALLHEKILERDAVKKKRCIAIAGIGNPDRFMQTLRDIKINVVEFRKYRDHYIYKKNDLEEIHKIMETTKSDYIVTTEKDAMRLQSVELPPDFPSNSIIYAIIEAIFVKGEKFLLNILNEKIDRLICK